MCRDKIAEREAKFKDTRDYVLLCAGDRLKISWEVMAEKMDEAKKLMDCEEAEEVEDHKEKLMYKLSRDIREVWNFYKDIMPQLMEKNENKNKTKRTGRGSPVKR